MPDLAVLLELVQTFGLAVAVLVVAVFALRRLHEQLSAVQEQRIADARSSTEQLLALVDRQHAQQELLARAIEGNADAVHELRALVQLDRAARPAVPPVRL